MEDGEKPIQIEVIESLRYMNESYFWDYIYRSNHVLQYFEDELQDVMQDVELIKEYQLGGVKAISIFHEHQKVTEQDEETSFTLRNIINAYRSRVHGIKTTFPINKLNQKELIAIENIYNFIQRHKYYPWDISKV